MTMNAATKAQEGSLSLSVFVSSCLGGEIVVAG